MNSRDYYERYWSPEGFCPHGALVPGVKRLLEREIRPASRCLDLGCGDGRTAGLWLRDRGTIYVGVDISENAVRDARALGLDALVVEDASTLPFPDNSFDAVICVEVLEHLFRPDSAAREALRVLNPGGRFVVSLPNVAYWPRRIELAVFGRWNPYGDDLSVERPWRDPHIRFFSPKTLERMLLEVGFARVRIGGHGGGLPFIGRYCGLAPDSRVYRALESWLPSVFAQRVNAVAVKRA